MAIQTITYADKTALNENAGVNAVNKCQASDLNEIKSVVNNNANELTNVIESGSNSNGKWVKYADGTMICYGTTLMPTLTMTTAFGSVFETSTATSFGTFPQTFYAAPVVTVTQTTGATATPEQVTDTTTTNIGKAFFWRPTSRSATGVNFNWLAVGRWKQ